MVESLLRSRLTDDDLRISVRTEGGYELGRWRRGDWRASCARTCVDFFGVALTDRVVVLDGKGGVRFTIEEAFAPRRYNRNEHEDESRQERSAAEGRPRTEVTAAAAAA